MSLGSFIGTNILNETNLNEMSGSSVGDVLIKMNSNNKIFFQSGITPNTSTGLCITPSNNIGIGTFDVKEKMDISGSIITESYKIQSIITPIIDISSNIKTPGYLNISKGLTINDNKFSVDALGNTKILGNLDISKNLNINNVFDISSNGNLITKGKLDISGSLNINNNFIISNSGDVLIKGLLDVTNKTTFNKDVSLNNGILDIGVNRTLYIDSSNNRVGIGGLPDATYNFYVKGNTKIKGDLVINGTTSIQDTSANSVTSFNITNNGTGPAIIVNQLGDNAVANFTDDNKSVLYMANNGLIGVGKIDPSYNLDISGTALVKQNLNVNNGLTLNKPKQIKQPTIVNATNNQIIEISGNVLGEKYFYTTFTNTTTPGSINFDQDTICDILVVGGGGQGSCTDGGGGGAGGLVFVPNKLFTQGTYEMNVGAGGNDVSHSGARQGTNGNDTVINFSGNTFLVAKGGGGGGSGFPPEYPGAPGGSGGGAGSVVDDTTGKKIGGNSIQSLQAGDSGIYGYGNKGGDNNGTYGGGGGGGAGEAGKNNGISNTLGLGGNGLAEITISGITYNFKTHFGLPTTGIGEYVSAENKTYFAGGGGGGHTYNPGSGTGVDKIGGKGGGGQGKGVGSSVGGLATTGGGGGGGGGSHGHGGVGGSGIIIIRWKEMLSDPNTTSVTLNNHSIVNNKLDISQGIIINDKLKIDTSGNLDTSGNVNVAGTVTVYGTISQSGVFNQDGDVNVSGDAILKGNLDISQNLRVNTDKFMIDPSFGNIAAKGTMDISGYFNVNNKFKIDSSGNITSYGTLDISKNFSINQSNLIIDSSGNVKSKGQVDISNNFIVNTNKFIVDISSNVKITGTLDISNNLTVNTNKLIINGTTGTVQTAGNVDISKNFSINTNKFIVDSSGNVTSAGTLDISNNLSINNNKFIVDNSGNIKCASNFDISDNFSLNTNSILIDKSGNILAKNALSGVQNFSINNNNFYIDTLGSSMAKGYFDLSQNMSVGFNVFKTNINNNYIGLNTSIDLSNNIHKNVLDISGNIGTSTCYFGDISNSIIISHRNNGNDTDFLIKQSSTGEITINSKSLTDTIDLCFDNIPQCSINSDGDMTLQGTLYTYSDIRIKENIKIVENAIEKVKALRGIKYNLIDEDENTHRKHIGLFAQDVEKVVPEAIDMDGDIKTVAYNNLIGLLVQATKELYTKYKTIK